MPHTYVRKRVLGSFPFPSPGVFSSRRASSRGDVASSSRRRRDDEPFMSCATHRPRLCLPKRHIVGNAITRPQKIHFSTQMAREKRTRFLSFSFSRRLLFSARFLASYFFRRRRRFSSSRRRRDDDDDEPELRLRFRDRRSTCQ